MATVLRFIGAEYLKYRKAPTVGKVRSEKRRKFDVALGVESFLRSISGLNLPKRTSKWDTGIATRLIHTNTP